jgi:hypothetical protein
MGYSRKEFPDIGRFRELREEDRGVSIGPAAAGNLEELAPVSLP